jgi:hypothetical protein
MGSEQHVHPALIDLNLKRSGKSECTLSGLQIVKLFETLWTHIRKSSL